MIYFVKLGITVFVIANINIKIKKDILR